jgi:phospholipid-binding lipoprotein MlaA
MRVSVSESLKLFAFAAGLALLGACSTANGPDPGRRVNETIFRFNNKLDTLALEPIAKGYDVATPGPLQRGIGNFFDNLKLPRTFLNDVLQGKGAKAADDVGRLLVNTVFGLGGLIDVASMNDMPRNDEDFGQTFGVWGVPPGPYVVLPVVGPPFNGANNPRDILAWPLDVATDPTTWVNAFGLGVVRTVDARARYLDELGQLRKDSIDFYVGVRDLYLQSRESDVRDGAIAPAQASDEDLYDVDELEDEGEEASDDREAEAADESP